MIFAAGLVVGTAKERTSQPVDLGLFWQVHQLLNKNYVGQIDQDKAAEGAAAGLVESLGDPYSAYLPPDQRRGLDEELKGEFEGIGAELENVSGLITVIAPLTDSPAAKAGLKPKDVVIKVDDSPTDGLTLAEVVKKIRGPSETTVRLTIVRLNQPQPLELTIQRQKIEIKSVVHRMIDGVGYIELRQFGDRTVEEFRSAVAAIKTSNPSAVILDLRNNPGGYLNDVAPIAGAFIPPSEVVKQVFRHGRVETIRSNGLPVMPSEKLIVLTNAGSASAAEILAGALQDHKRATVVGEKTFGKGSVQDIIDLSRPAGSALRVTIAEWQTPLGRSINKIGLEPDIKVADQKTDSSDPILAKALLLAK